MLRRPTIHARDVLCAARLCVFANAQHIHIYCKLVVREQLLKGENSSRRNERNSPAELPFGCEFMATYCRPHLQKACTCYRRIWTKNIVHIIHSEGKFGTTASHNGRYKLISIIRCYWYWLEKNAFNIKVLIIKKFEDV